MANPSKSGYIRWVQGIAEPAAPAPPWRTTAPALLEYRSWLITFQMKHKLAVNAKVDRPTQDALIEANEEARGLRSLDHRTPC